MSVPNGAVQLYIALDGASQTARISGPGTFHLKERIKSLGATWDGARKSWTIVSCAYTAVEFEELFAGVRLDISVTESQNSSISGGTYEAKGGQVAEESFSRPSAVESPKDPLPVPTGLSVSSFLSNVELALRSAFPRSVFIFGVVTKVTNQGNRAFIDITDPENPTETVSCVIWGDVAKVCAGLTNAGFALEANLEVMFQASVKINRRRGALSLSIERVVAEYTIAKVGALRELTNNRLKEEGLFDRNRNLALPFLPRRLGILTSESGTVINDFLASLELAQFGFELSWLKISVQGVAAKDQIIRGLTILGQSSHLDAILLFRGGGSPAELAVFSDYDVARAVATSPIPVLSAIGHEEDQSSTQDVSWKYFGVPKDLGRYFAELIIERRRSIEAFVGEIDQRVNFIIERLSRETLRLTADIRQFSSEIWSSRSHEVTTLGGELSRYAAEELRSIEQALGYNLQNIRHSTTQIGEQLDSALKLRLERIRSGVGRGLGLFEERLSRQTELVRQAGRTVELFSERVENLGLLVQSASPEVQMKRGFAIVKQPEGEGIITRASDVAPGSVVSLQFADDSVLATIKGK